MPKPTALLLANPRSGSADAAALRRAAAAHGVELHELGPADDPAALARSSGAGILGVAAGDGTLGAVAAVAVERDVPFFCVPVGTRNHFARGRLDKGLLHLYVARVTLGGSARLRVAIDGEPADLEAPVDVRIAPRALRLLVPR